MSEGAPAPTSWALRRIGDGAADSELVTSSVPEEFHVGPPLTQGLARGQSLVDHGQRRRDGPFRAPVVDPDGARPEPDAPQSAEEADDSVFMALRAGARGYVLRDADDEELVLSIRAVGKDEAIFSPAIATRVLAYFAASAQGGAPPQAFPTLTEREREILHLIAKGHPNPSIARQLSLSTKTVGNYVSNIFTKLQVADRTQAIIRAREAGLG